MEQKKYPECEKLTIFRHDIATIQDFLEWLMEKKKISVAYLTHETIESLIRQFLEIDENKLEEERREIIAEFSKKAETKEDS